MKRKHLVKKEILNKRAKGSMTIYLVLMIVLSLILICTLLESARVNAMSAKVKGITYMSMDSVFSEYAKPVFEDYGVMFLWCNESNFNSRFNGFAEKNLKEAGTSLIGSTDLYNISLSESSVTAAKWATDENGDIFEDQVDEYMKYHFTEAQAEKLLNNLDIFDEGSKINDFFEKINKYEDVFKKVEKSVEKVKEKIESVKNLAQKPLTYLNNMKSSLENYKENKSSVSKDDFYKAEQRLKETKDELSSSLDEISEVTDSYHEDVQNAQDSISKLKSEIEIDEADYSSETYSALKEEIDEIKAKSGDLDDDYYGIENAGKEVSSYKEQLSSLDGLFSQIDSEQEFNADELLSYVENYQSMFSGFNLSGLNINFSNEEVEKESSGFLDTVSGIISKGVLGYVCDDVSEKEVSTSDFPSVTVSKSKSNSDESLLNQTAKKAIFSEYIKEHFGNYTNVLEDKALDYETEYIIVGKSSDEKNLKGVVDRLVAIRTGLNSVSLLKDGQKKAEALALATAIVGFTGMPVLVKIMQLAILGAWAAAEAVIDVKTLLNGEKVSLIKGSNEWNLSLSGLKEFSASSIKGAGSKTGQDYETYLRILLIAENREKQIYQTMDIIQANMQKNENENFELKNCLASVTLNAQYQASQLFVSIPLVGNYVGNTGGKYSFTINQEYS